MKTDEQLVKAANNGSEEAFSELLHRYRDKLLRFLLTRCGSQADAEDAIQDTFVNVYRYLGSFDPRWRFSTWLYRIAIRNLGKQAGSESTSDATDELPGGHDPLQLCLEHGERENMWLTAKRVLSADAFNAMWLHYIEDMPVNDVSQALDRSVSWTKVTMLRARRRLTRTLQEESAGSARSGSYG